MLIRPILFFLFLISTSIVFAQPFHQQLAETYEQFRSPTIEERRFKQVDILPTIKRLVKHRDFTVEKVGQSIEGREILLVKAGTGAEKILLWSQMHGDEPTATMALMDIFSFLTKSGDQFDDWRANLFNDVTLYFIPMLNPDGAERYQRRNALGIDLNRDALRLQSPEAQILKQIRDQTEADWGFNLHDQSRYYTAGINKNTATISFLAPAYNYEKTVNKGRANSMKLIAAMNNVLQKYIPQQVAKYNDDFEPRAFGDNIQKWGTSTILIESGGLRGDLEKQEIRKVNYLALLTAFDAIAKKTYQKYSQADYVDIPENERYLHELLIRGATVNYSGKDYILDLGFKREETSYADDRRFYSTSYIADVGDLSTYYGYEEVDATGMKIVDGAVYPKTLNSMAEVQNLSLLELQKDGYLYVKVANLEDDEHWKQELPVQIIAVDKSVKNVYKQGRNPAFYLTKNGVKQYAVVNGVLYKM